MVASNEVGKTVEDLIFEDTQRRKEEEDWGKTWTHSELYRQYKCLGFCSKSRFETSMKLKSKKAKIEVISYCT